MKNLPRWTRFAVLLGLAVTGSTAMAEPPRLAAVPKAPAWTLGQRFVTALNGYDRPALEHFLAEHLSPAALRQQAIVPRARELLQTRRQLGKLEIVETSGVPHALVFDVRNAARTAAAEIVIVMEASDSGLADEIVVVPSSL